MQIEEYVATLVPVDSTIQSAIQLNFKEVKLPKGEVVFREGQVAKQIYFIESGLARMYYYNESGKDITYVFFTENNFMAPSESFLEQQPSKYFIELLEDSKLRVISKDGLEKMLEQFPILEKIKTHILSYFLYQANKRIVALQFQNAQQRYETLEETQGDILTRVSLGQIASYLGITQETLSRIRGKK